MVGTETIAVHPDRNFVIDRETAQEIRTAFAQEVARIPNIEGGLGWKMFLPYVDNNGEMAQALIALGAHLQLWQVMPDPESCAAMYATHPNLLPQSGVISSWPSWSGVRSGGDGAPRLEHGEKLGMAVPGTTRNVADFSEGEAPPAYEEGAGGEYDPEELANFLKQF